MAAQGVEGAAPVQEAVAKEVAPEEAVEAWARAEAAVAAEEMVVAGKAVEAARFRALSVA